MNIDDAILIEYALDTLPADARAAVEDVLRDDPSARAALAELEEALGEVGAAADLAPPPELRGELLASVAGDFAGFRRRVAALFGISDDAADAQLVQLRLAPQGQWQQTRLAGVYTLPSGGAAAADARFVYVAPGYNVPAHRHHGLETMLIIDGYATESTGRDIAPGDMVFSQDQSIHHFAIKNDDACLFAVTIDGTLEYL